MMKYKVNVTGTVHDTDTDFKCGFDMVVENGGSLEEIGKSIQTAIDSMKAHGTPAPIEQPEPQEGK